MGGEKLQLGASTRCRNRPGWLQLMHAAAALPPANPACLRSRADQVAGRKASNHSSRQQPPVVIACMSRHLMKPSLGLFCTFQPRRPHLATSQTAQRAARYLGKVYASPCCTATGEPCVRSPHRRLTASSTLARLFACHPSCVCQLHDQSEARDRIATSSYNSRPIEIVADFSRSCGGLLRWQLG